jgi:hypothetical protein
MGNSPANIQGLGPFGQILLVSRRDSKNMKRTLWFAAAVFATTLICGCGGEEKQGSNATSKVDSAVPPALKQVASFKSSTPKEAVTEFLEALRTGDKTTTEALLTSRAREETAAHDLVVEPPGAPSATYSVGRVQVDGDEGSAYVSCVWSEKEDDSEFEVVWILREETEGWRVAGMATQLPDTDEPVVLNFEDLSELEDKMQEAEVAQQQPANPTQGPGTLQR